MEDKCSNELKYEDIKDGEYYSALQDSLQSYDAKLWQVPGLFFIIIGLLINGLDKIHFWSSLFNGIVFILASALISLLLTYYYKAHLFFLIIQEKINEFDDIYNKNERCIKRLPLSSMRKERLILNLAILVGKGKLKISGVQYFVAGLRLYIKLLMFIALFINLFLGLYITVPIIYKLFT